MVLKACIWKDNRDMSIKFKGNAAYCIPVKIRISQGEGGGGGLDQTNW